MATYVLGFVLLGLMLMAARHVWQNILSGRHDCCGCTACDDVKMAVEPVQEAGCGGGCSSCCSCKAVLK